MKKGELGLAIKEKEMRDVWVCDLKENKEMGLMKMKSKETGEDAYNRLQTKRN